MKTWPRLPNLGALLRRHFFAGLLVVIPLGVIAWIITWALGALWSLHELLPEPLRPENHLSDPSLVNLLNGAIALAAAIVLAFGISTMGWVSKHYFGQKLLEALADVIQRIPVVRSIYSALDQLLRALAAGGGQQFNRVVYVEFPRKGAWTLAFVTGSVPAPGTDRAGEEERGSRAGGSGVDRAGYDETHLSVFVPATPNPTSGFYFVVPASEVRESHMHVEEAFKVILSLGIAKPNSGRRGIHGE